MRLSIRSVCLDETNRPHLRLNETRSRSVHLQSDHKSTKSRVDIWRPRDFKSIELHRGMEITFEYPRHWHDEFYLCAILEGVAYLDSAGTSILIPRGTLAMVPSGEVHANRKLRCTFRCIFMEFKALHSAIEQFVEQTIPGLNFRTTLIDDARTIASFLRLHRSLEKSSSRLGRDHSLLVFLHRLLTRHGTASITLSRDGNEDSAVRRSKKFLDDHYADRVLLHELARLTGLSPYHLNRSFCRKIGMPPHAYQLQVRIARAKSALRAGSSVARVALATGFADQSHFTHVFKRLVGDTPAQYWLHSKNLQDSPDASH
jgi:AraC-like DNA-binding protein